ncbi:MAG: hypothetical protein FWE50_03000 [Alphaproteobacteria bacterium]|nr:hypothetical protein [Alphaproteobacteria bacterium]
MAKSEIKNHILTERGLFGRVKNRWIVIDETLWVANEEVAAKNTLEAEKYDYVMYNGKEIQTNWDENHFNGVKEKMDPMLAKIGKGGLKHVLVKTTKRAGGKFSSKGKNIEYKTVTVNGEESKCIPYHKYVLESEAAERGAHIIILHLNRRKNEIEKAVNAHLK